MKNIQNTMSDSKQEDPATSQQNQEKSEDNNLIESAKNLMTTVDSVALENEIISSVWVD